MRIAVDFVKANNTDQAAVAALDVLIKMHRQGTMTLWLIMLARCIRGLGVTGPLGRGNAQVESETTDYSTPMRRASPRAPFLQVSCTYTFYISC